MADIDPLLAEATIFNVNSEVIGLTPSVALCSTMLALAGDVSRQQIAATNQLQLASMTAMLEMAREYGERVPNPAVKEVLDLVKQVVATAQSS